MFPVHLTDEEYAAISGHLTPEVRTVLSTEGSLNSRNSQGGTAPAAVERQLLALDAEFWSMLERHPGRRQTHSARDVTGVSWMQAGQSHPARQQ